MTLKSIHVENFQSLDSVDLELGAFTVIVGPSNTGKSALVRAITALASNQSGGDFIRAGQKECVVRLNFDDNSSVAWAKPEKGGATYSLTSSSGQETLFQKPGREVPEPVDALLNLRRVEVDAVKLFPQIARQFDAPFLLTESSQKAARILAKVTKLEQILGALGLCAKDVRRGRDELKALEARIASVTEDLTQFDTLDEDLLVLDNLREIASEHSDDVNAVSEESEMVASYLALLPRTMFKPVPVGRIDSVVKQLDAAIAAHGLVSDYRTAIDTAQRYEESFEEANLRVAELSKQIAAIKTCPACGQPVEN